MLARKVTAAATAAPAAATPSVLRDIVPHDPTVRLSKHNRQTVKQYIHTHLRVAVMHSIKLPLYVVLLWGKEWVKILPQARTIVTNYGGS